MTFRRFETHMLRAVVAAVLVLAAVHWLHTSESTKYLFAQHERNGQWTTQ